jgi:hypothetical protein
MSRTVDIFAVPDPDHEDNEDIVLDLVEDSVVALPDTVFVAGA